MGWFTEPDEGGGGASEMLDPGDYDGQVARIITAKNDGTAMASSSGDPQILVILEDLEQSGEATCYVTFSDKGKWVLKALLKAVGADMGALDAEQATADDFQQQDVCDKYLTGKSLRFRVVHKKSPKNQQTYANALPIVPADAPKLAGSMKPAKMSEDEFNRQRLVDPIGGLPI